MTNSFTRPSRFDEPRSSGDVYLRGLMRHHPLHSPPLLEALGLGYFIELLLISLPNPQSSIALVNTLCPSFTRPWVNDEPRTIEDVSLKGLLRHRVCKGDETSKVAWASSELLPQRKIDVTSKPPVGGISVVTLIRTDTTLDHSQKAEKVWDSKRKKQILNEYK